MVVKVSESHDKGMLSTLKLGDINSKEILKQYWSKKVGIDSIEKCNCANINCNKVAEDITTRFLYQDGAEVIEERLLVPLCKKCTEISNVIDVDSDVIVHT